MKFEPKGSTEEAKEPEQVLSVNRSKAEDKPKSVLSNRRASTTEFEVDKLPSSFKAYPPNTRVFSNSYSYREIKFLSDSKIPLDKQYEVMLEGIEVSSMDSRLLTFFDFLYISTLRKLASLGATSYRVPYICDKCKNNGLHTFTLEDIGFKTLDVEDLPVVVNFYTIGENSFVPLTVGDYIELYAGGNLHLKDKKGEILRQDGIKVVDSVAILSMMCTNLSYEEAYETLSNAREPEDLLLLDDLENLLEHYMKPLLFNCPAPLEKVKPGTHPSQIKTCKNKISVGLLGGESLVIPFREHGESVESRISFGSKRLSKSA